MKRNALITIAAAGLTLAAAPSYAQSSYGGNTGDSYGNSSDRATSKAERKARKAAKEAEKARKKAEKMKAEAMKEDCMKAKSMKKDAVMSEPMMTKDHSSATGVKMMKDEEQMMAKDEKAMMMQDDANQVKTKSMLPENCPSGTTPQADGTCILK